MIEIELWKIDNSRTAVKFNVVEQQNEWAKSVKESGAQSETKLFQLEFWSAFREAAKDDKDFMQVFSLRKAHAQAWYDLSIGNSSRVISLRLNTQKNHVTALLYISGDKELFSELRNASDSIEEEMGHKMVWTEASKDCTINIIHKCDLRKKEEWPELFSWMREQSLLIRKVFKTRVG